MPNYLTKHAIFDVVRDIVCYQKIIMIQYI